MIHITLTDWRGEFANAARARILAEGDLQRALAACETMRGQLKLREGAMMDLQPKGKAREKLLALLSGHGPQSHPVRAALAALENLAIAAEFDSTMPTLTSEARHFNAGRAAALRDAQNTFEQLVLAAQKPQEAEK